MKNNYPLVGACLFLCFIGLNKLSAQSGPEFLDCSTSPVSLCVSDEGVRLPANNKIYLGEEDPEASSCSVHLTRKTSVRSSCGRDLQYEVQLFLNDDTSNVILLQSLRTVTTDSAFEAELSFDSELSPDSMIRLNGIPYTNGCASFHRIRWIVSDTCGQVTVCDRLIDLYDCHPPVLVNQPNVPFIINLTVGCRRYLFAKDFIVDILDDCTPENTFLLSLKEEKYLPDSIYYDYCDIPAFKLELPFDIWIADAGRDIDCNGTIEWTERNKYKQTVMVVYQASGLCHKGCKKDPYIGGEILTPDSEGVEKVYVNLYQQGHVYPTFVTLGDGKFGFYALNQPGYDINIHVRRNDSHKNGVSTLDLVRIQKHLLGIEKITNPYTLIAADANNGQSISVIDLIELRKLILGIYTEFPQNLSWRFVPEKFIFQDTLHPWPFPETITINNIENPGNTDFIGIKVGDVNYTASPNAQQILNRGSAPEIKWHVNQKEYLENEIIEIPFFVDDALLVQGFQFTITSPDLEFVDASSETINLSDENFSLFDDKITMSWFNEEGIRFSKDDIVFTLKARAKSNGTLQNSLTINSEITEAEVYSMKDEVFAPKLVIKNDSDSGVSTFPEPNPWKIETKISFHLKQPGNVIFEIFDLNGQSVFSKTANFNAGQNEIIVQSSDFPARGILFYSIKTNEFISSNKMMVLD